MKIMSILLNDVALSYKMNCSLTSEEKNAQSVAGTNK